MNKQVKGLLYFLASDIRHSLLIFWSILLLVLVVSISFGYFLLGVEDGEMAFGFPFAIYFYCLVLGFMTVKQSVPFAIKMGATRKNLYISLAIFFMGLALLKAIVANTIQSLVQLFIDNAELSSFRFLHPALLMEDTWINRVLLDVGIMFLFMAFMFLIGLIFYKYGMTGGGIVAGILGILLLFSLAKGWILDFIMKLVEDLNMVVAAQLIGLGIVLYLLSFIFIRNITIEQGR